MANKDVLSIAGMLTDDPDIFNEWFGKGPQTPAHLQKLSVAFGISDIDQLQELHQEMVRFAKYRPSLKTEQDVLKAFVTYKRTGQLPGNLDSADMDKLGGEFRPGSPDRVVSLKKR